MTAKSEPSESESESESEEDEEDELSEEDSDNVKVVSLIAFCSLFAELAATELDAEGRVVPAASNSSMNF